MTPNRRLLVLLLAAAGVCSHAQVRDVAFEHYTLDDGLSNNVVTSIVQDKFGFIWIATEDGLNRFDGIGFTIYKHDSHDSSSIVSSIILSLCSDSAGNLWVGTSGGLDRYDPGPDRFIHYDHFSGSTIALGDGVKSLASDKFGGLWIVTLRNGLLRYNPHNNNIGRLRPDDPLVAISSLCAARDGRIWYSIPSLGLSVCDTGGRGLRSYHIPVRNPGARDPEAATAISEDREGYIWYSTFGNGVGRLNPEDGKLVTFRHASRDAGSLADDAVSSILAGAHGVIWAGTYYQGIDRYDPGRRLFGHYPHDPVNPHSVSSQRVYALYEDRRGSLWAGTWQGGVSVYHPWRQKFTWRHHIPGDPHSLSNDTVWALCQDVKGRLWVGTEGGGLDRYDSSRSGIVHYLHTGGNPRGLSTNHVIALAEDHAGRLWIGTYGGGLDRFDEGRGAFVHYRHDPRNPSSLPSDAVMRIFEDHAHQLWLGCNAGELSRFDPASGVFRNYSLRDSAGNGSLEGDVEAIAEDPENNIWIGTFGSGLFRIDPARHLVRSYLRSAADSGSFPAAAILSLALDPQGGLWVGTFAKGLFRYNRGTDRFDEFTERDGLPSNYVKGIVPDDRGNLWLSSIKGLARFTPASRAVRSYDVSDGVQSNEFRTGSCSRGADGRVFFGGVRGFNEFIPESLRDNPAPPPVVLTALRVFDQPVRFENALANMDAVELSHDQNFFSLEFVALDYTASRKNQYAYKLEGVDRDWVMCGTRRFASYTHLDGGEYLFRVKGSNNDGVWNETGTSLRIVIHPPFWQTAWFRVLLAVLIAGVPFLVYRNRYRRLLAIEQTRSRIARDLHDELSATLSGINFFAQAISKDGGNAITGNSRRFLSLIHESAGSLQESISDIIWSVNPGEDHWNQIVAKFRRYASDLLDSKSISYRFDFPAELPERPVPMERKRTIWLIYKEIVTNTAKHSSCTNVSITLRMGGDRGAELVIEDDGRGFDPEKSGGGNGLRNITSRARSAGIDAAVSSSPGKGTTWHVRFTA
jgi:ligand-binding sensor domain-containing protein